MFPFLALIFRKFVYWRIKLIQLIKTQRAFSNLNLNGLWTIKFITITEPQAFHTTFLHVYRFYYSSDEMVSLPSLWIIYKGSSAIFLKQYPLVFTYNRSKIPVPAFNLYKNIIPRVKYTGERRRDNMQVNIAFWMHCQLVNFYFVHISTELCVRDARNAYSQLLQFYYETSCLKILLSSYNLCAKRKSHLRNSLSRIPDDDQELNSKQEEKQEVRSEKIVQ